MMPRKSLRKKANVGFGDVEVIELAMVPGENHPSQRFIYEADSGDENDSQNVPNPSQLENEIDTADITLGWEAQSRTKIDLETFEENKKKRMRMGKKLKRMSRSVRKRILRNIGVETSDIESEDESRAERRRRKKKKKKKKRKMKKEKREKEGRGKMSFKSFGIGGLSPTKPKDRFSSGSEDFQLSKMDAAPKVPSRDSAPGVPRRRNSLDLASPLPMRSLSVTSETEGGMESRGFASPPQSSSSHGRRSSIGHALGAMVKQPVRLAKYTSKKVGKLVSIESNSASGRASRSNAAPIPRPPVYTVGKTSSIDHSNRTSGDETIGGLSNTSFADLTTPNYVGLPQKASQRSALQSSLNSSSRGNALPKKPMRSGILIDGFTRSKASLPIASFEDDGSLDSNGLSGMINPEVSLSPRSRSLDESLRSKRRSNISSVTNAIGALAKQPVRLVKYTTKKVRLTSSFADDLQVDPPSTGRQRSVSISGSALDASARTAGSVHTFDGQSQVGSVFTPPSTSRRAKRERRRSISSVSRALGSLVKKRGKISNRSSNSFGDDEAIETVSRKSDEGPMGSASLYAYTSRSIEFEGVQLAPKEALAPIIDISSRDMSTEKRSSNSSLKKDSRHQRATPPEVSLRSATTENSRLDDTLRGSLRPCHSSGDQTGTELCEPLKTGETNPSNASIRDRQDLEQSQGSLTIRDFVTPRRISMTGEVHPYEDQCNELSELRESNKLETPLSVSDDSIISLTDKSRVLGGVDDGAMDASMLSPPTESLVDADTCVGPERELLCNQRATDSSIQGPPALRLVDEGIWLADPLRGSFGPRRGSKNQGDLQSGRGLSEPLKTSETNPSNASICDRQDLEQSQGSLTIRDSVTPRRISMTGEVHPYEDQCNELSESNKLETPISVFDDSIISLTDKPRVLRVVDDEAMDASMLSLPTESLVDADQRATDSSIQGPPARRLVDEGIEPLSMS